jgi:dihydroflavonol-4-reductase
VRKDPRLPHLDAFAPERVEGRLDDEGALTAALAGADTVVHLAAIVSFRPEDRAAMFATNARATEALAALARKAGVRRFLHVSTISAIGYSDRPVELDERAPYNFGRLGIGYCDSKFAAERSVLDAARRGLDAVIVNPPSMYGAGDRRKGDGSLLTAICTGQVKVAPPGGINVATVDDVCDGIVAAIARGRTGDRYILGGENLTGTALLGRVAAIVGARAPRRTLPRSVVLAGARALAWKERMFGSRPPMTSEVLPLAGRFLWYSSDKAARELDWRAGPVDAGIDAAWREIQAAS